ncbi:MAG: MBOAT family protein [Acidobacteria bacterium]|nr:MBOAT family protein [Acidobacteriota bacterium]
MRFVSFEFAAFVLLLLALYYILPRRAQNPLLLAASYGFYATWSWRTLPLLIGLTGITYFAGRRLPGSNRPRVLLLAGIGLNLTAIAALKYAEIVVPGDPLLVQPEMPPRFDVTQALIPIGVSFYALGAISYLIDVYRRQMAPARALVDFALYMAYFPKLLAGPIERARVFLPQLRRSRVVDNAVVARSGMLITLGVIRKVLLGDQIQTLIPVAAFSDPSRFSAPELAVFAAAFLFAVYNDFAGYTDIVRGVSALFGIELSRNFNAPFFARNVFDLWLRWHVTLSLWLRDYIYMPLSRAMLRRDSSQRNLATLAVPAVVTMVASGLWHQASPHMVAWGLLMGVCLFAMRVYAVRRPSGAQHLPGVLRVLLPIAVVFVIVPFRTDLHATWEYWTGLVRWTNLRLPDATLVILMVFSLAVDWAQTRAEDEYVFLRWPRLVQSAVLAAAVLAVFLANGDRSGLFIYQGF